MKQQSVLSNQNIGRPGNALSYFRGMISTILILVPAAILLFSCATLPQEDVGDYILQYVDSEPQPSKFKFCYNHGCSSSMLVSLDSEQWNQARDVFQPRPQSGSEERIRISLAIGLLETIMGKITGTGKIGGIRGWIPGNRFDCIDDTVNTSTYLYMLRKDGLILYHEVRGPARRGFLIDGKWPHVATVIIEKETGDAFVVDSWFLDNGNPAFVVPYKDWLAGWKPRSGR